jgi:hypothetical protein
MNDEKLDKLLDDDLLGDDVLEEEDNETLIDFGDDEIEPIAEDVTTTTTEIQTAENAPSGTIQKVGIAALIGLLGWFFAKNLKGKKENKTEQGNTNFKPVDFGF